MSIYFSNGLVQPPGTCLLPLQWWMPNPVFCFLRRRETRKAKKEAVTWAAFGVADRSARVKLVIGKICWSFSILQSLCVYYIYISRWWFQIFFMFIPTWGKIPNLTNIAQGGWNHQLVYIYINVYTVYQSFIVESQDFSFATPLSYFQNNFHVCHLFKRPHWGTCRSVYINWFVGKKNQHPFQFANANS